MALTGCSQNTEVVSEYSLYYLNQDKTKVVPVAYKPSTDDIDTLIDDVLGQILKDTSSIDYTAVYPETVSILDTSLKDGILTVNFSDGYKNLTTYHEISARNALVHNMVQFDGIDAVKIMIDGKPLTNSSGIVVGAMSLNDFLENPEEELGNIKEARIALYFSSIDGNKLVREIRDVQYSGNISEEKLVLQRLLEGPSTSYAREAIPSNTEMISVAVMDGNCFVNLSEGFLVQNFGIREDVVIYSIVNTLTSLSNVENVQISVNGDTNIIYRNNMSLGDYYSKNTDLVISETEARELMKEVNRDEFND